MAGVYNFLGVLAKNGRLSIYTMTGARSAPVVVYIESVVLGGSLHIHQEMVYTSRFLIFSKPKPGGVYLYGVFTRGISLLFSIVRLLNCYWLSKHTYVCSLRTHTANKTYPSTRRVSQTTWEPTMGPMGPVGPLGARVNRRLAVERKRHAMSFGAFGAGHPEYQPDLIFWPISVRKTFGLFASCKAPT